MAVRCNRCDRSYRTQKAFRQHIRDSPIHHACPVCPFDGTSWNDLLAHCRKSGCRSVCGGCNDGNGSHWVANCDEYYEHIDDFNVCTDCERHFTSPNHLHQHRLSHRKPKYRCYRCAAVFRTYGGMIIHLEYGTCSDINSTHLNKLAASCRKWDYFIDARYRDELLDDGDTVYNVNVFKCPTCHAKLRKLSSLFQHVESDACEQTLEDNRDIGRLRKDLERNLA